MNFYNSSGFIDISAVRKAAPGAWLFVLLGSRQIGKTYGIIDYFHSMQEPYIYLRSTIDEVKYSLSAKANLYAEKGYTWAENMRIEDGKPCRIYDNDYEEGKIPVAMAVALSEVGKIRGYGASKTKRIFYDEFIPTSKLHEMKNKGALLLDCYVTVNSNREIHGLPPCELWLAANSNSLDNDILQRFGLVQTIINNRKKRKTFSYYPEKGLCIVDFCDSPISAKMANSAVFRCIGANDDYSRMAIENEFVNDDMEGVKSCPLVEFVLSATIDNLSFYKHKSFPRWYVVINGEISNNYYTSSNATFLNAFISWWRYNGSLNPVDGKNIFYNSYAAKLAFYKLLKIK